ncbi:hypothetical protein ACHHYP_06010 [Achlya hypogyna]|uniref:Uncharacterized protein n=1 Tax=Achlya hypogyna TaxID=1202772 RepID=A0A1V9ZNC7_ACHHY|nr:hypothetical protein ACHHYP_06010 [Achlya hypogyna]
MTEATARAVQAALAGDWTIVANIIAGRDDLLLNATIEPQMGYTMLHLACRDNQREIVQLLLVQPQLDINRRDHNGQTALHLVCHYEYLDIVADLIAEPYIEIDAHDDDGCTPLHASMYHSQPTCAKLLLGAGASTTVRNNVCAYLLQIFKS